MFADGVTLSQLSGEWSRPPWASPPNGPH